MIGEHRLTLHETNAQAFVPICSCGFIGLAHVHPGVPDYAALWAGEQRDSAMGAALAEFSAHVDRCARPLVDRMRP